EKSERLTFPPRLEIRQKSPDFHIPTAPTATLTSQLPKRLHILATVTALSSVGFSFDDEPTVNSKDELTVPTFGSSDLRRLSVPT
ncbi:MAG: hypothetical protein ABSB82_09540, partial [Terriglobia bacterium]